MRTNARFSSLVLVVSAVWCGCVVAEPTSSDGREAEDAVSAPTLETAKNPVDAFNALKKELERVNESDVIKTRDRLYMMKDVLSSYKDVKGELKAISENANDKQVSDKTIAAPSTADRQVTVIPGDITPAQVAPVTQTQAAPQPQPLPPSVTHDHPNEFAATRVLSTASAPVVRERADGPITPHGLQAQVLHQGGTRWIRLGDHLGEWRVVSVRADHVVVQAGKRRYTIGLSFPVSTAAQTIAPVPTTAPAPQVPGAIPGLPAQYQGAGAGQFFDDFRANNPGVR